MATSARKSEPKTATAKRRQVDWPAVERDYRTSQMTLRELGDKHGCDHAAIARKSKNLKWERDLTNAVRQATNNRLIEDAVNKAVTNSQQAVTNTVLIAAELNAQVIYGHRQGLKRITAIKERLLDQIEQATALMPELSDVIEMVRKENDRGIDKANDALRKAMSRSGLIDDLKTLAEVDEKVRKGEREAFGITSGEEESLASQKPKRVTLEFVDAVIK